MKFHKNTEFKDTTVGKIPRSWQIGNLAEFSKTRDAPVQTGPFGAQLHASDYVDEGIPLILIKNVLDGRIIEQDMPRISESKASQLARYRLKKGDTVFSRVGSVGRGAVVKKHQEGWLVSGQMLRVRLENPQIDNDFLSYAIMTKWFQRALESRTVGATRKSINTKILSNLPLIVPAISEQYGIVEVLSCIDLAIQKTGEVIVKTERLKKGLMQQLLTKGIGHKEFKETKIGKIPKEWQVTKVGKHVELLTGFPFKSSLFSKDKSGIKLVRGINVTTGRLRWDRTQYWKKSIEGLEKYFLAEKDVLIGMDGALVGHNYAIVNKRELPLLLVQRVARLRVKGDLHPEFLYHLIGNQPFLRYVESVNTSSGIAHISGEQIKDFKIPLPSFDEQLRIVDILSTVGNKLKLEIEEEAKLKRVKQVLMDLLLSGKVRVEVD
jgi:type I restriction enzyme S subunit